MYLQVDGEYLEIKIPSHKMKVDYAGNYQERNLRPFLKCTQARKQGKVTKGPIGDRGDKRNSIRTLKVFLILISKKYSNITTLLCHR